MNSLFYPDGSGQIICPLDPEFAIDYQIHMMERSAIRGCCPYRFEEGQLIYRIPEALETDPDMAMEPSIHDIKRRFHNMRDILNSSREMFMDDGRWVWDDLGQEQNEITGQTVSFYIPDRRFYNDTHYYIRTVVDRMVHKSLEQGWQGKELILYLHRISRMVRLADPKLDVTKLLLAIENTPQEAVTAGFEQGSFTF